MSRVTTVAQLKQFLASVPDATPLIADGPDCGGCDVQTCFVVDVELIENYQDTSYDSKTNRRTVHDLGPYVSICGIEKDAEARPEVLK